MVAVTYRAPLPFFTRLVHETLKVIVEAQASLSPVQSGFNLMISLFHCSFMAKLCSLCC